MKTVVVLGGSGFVGRSLCAALAAAGHSVYSVSRSPAAYDDALINSIDCNFDNVYQLGELYQRADVIFHLACDTTPATSSAQPSLEVTANLLPSLRLLEYLEQHCQATLIYVSSGGTIYGDEHSGRCDERGAMAPISYYGAGKGAIELFLHAYSRQTGNRVVVLRPSNIYGPGQLAKRQFGLVPTLLAAAMTGRSFELMGDGEQLRDFLFIDDFVALCLASLDDGRGTLGRFNVYNAGSGRGLSVMDVIRAVERVTGQDVALNHGPSRSVDVRSIVIVSTKAEGEFGWAAETGIEEGLRQTWEWQVTE